MRKTTLLPLIQFSLYTISFLLLLLFSHANCELNDQEQAVLLNLKKHWQNPQPLGHWTPSNSSSHCSWPEINCTDGLVTGISLKNMNINGTVPPFICDLKNLTTLDLSNNYMTSNEFPRPLYNCSKLQYLDLSQNFFAGTVPDNIHRMAQLRLLNLGANSFSGNIPASIGQLTELRSLQLFACQFNGSFPPEIGNLSNLKQLELAYMTTIMPARLPSEFTKLKKLKYLWVTGSNLVREIPETIGEMAALEHLDLSINNLSGKIPRGLFLLKNLSIVYLYKNKLSGKIPQVVEALNIDVVDLSENNLTGTIPDDFGRLTKLSGLGLFINQLSGKIPDNLGRLPRLINFNLFSNNLSGTLPPDLGQFSMLEEFQVSSNRLSGQLPQHLGDNGRLVGVVAFDNDLSGELPQSLGNCNNLIILSVHNNRFSGNVPSGIWTLPNLSKLLLSNNSFTGELPERLSLNLSRLEMSYNKFSGKIPAGVSFSKNLVYLDASNNLLNSTIPQELTVLPLLTALLLDHNQLSGFLPSDIISWKLLTRLNLSRNEISGQIPKEFGSLLELSELDLSKNQLSGQIPSQLGHLKLFSLNLSSNHLTGRIPSEFENDAYVSSFLNNPRLCANWPSQNIIKCNSKNKNSSKNSFKLLAWIIGLVIAILLGLLASFFVVGMYMKRKHGLDLTWELTSFQRLNFTESDILSGIRENNMIGSGGSGKVYRVAVNPSRDIVAVKRIWNNKKPEQKLEKEFLTEVKILSSIQHANIVKLRCCISSGHSKLLVYEYLENRSLDLWLHRKSSRASTISGSVQPVVLDWPKRFQIAVGAARGLSYMHHDCSPPIVHRDVKSSNILLDSEFNAKIADFGLAKMLIKQGESATMSNVAGSFGYIAPEYARTTRVNEKIDVYSFGVILLELATARKACDGDEHTSLAEWAWRQFQEGGPIVDALDEEVKELCYLDEMCCVFELGIICTGTLPSTRPSMKEVLKVLLRCNQPLVYGEKKNAATLTSTV
ncbi:receptor-like protein kinase 5 [Alnus glutinosa]|uniref:receptor-like protein kinase 5 n=1 Tax=Alnus glutinosa TaxID=3517 RepID=UPI002D78C2CF|nr:receptor-like protein kinase 5 [Alnus glutinosa]